MADNTYMAHENLHFQHCNNVNDCSLHCAIEASNCESTDSFSYKRIELTSGPHQWHMASNCIYSSYRVFHDVASKYLLKYSSEINPLCDSHLDQSLVQTWWLYACDWPM